MNSLAQPPQNPPPDPLPNPLDRLKVLINSSTPIVVMETVEEVRALALVRMACSELNLAVFEWTIADGLVRSGSGGAVPPPAGQTRAVLPPAGSDAGASPRTRDVQHC